jgi:hypothetical protein
MDNTSHFYGLVTFDRPIMCAHETLGGIGEVVLGGINGYLKIPNPAEWTAETKEPLRQPLLPPDDASTWKLGDEPFEWGTPFEYPEGTASVKMALLVFNLKESEIPDSGTQIYRNFDNWIELFVGYVELITKHYLFHRVKMSGNQPSGFDLFCWDSDNKPCRPYKRESLHVSLTLPSKNSYLKLHQFNKICELSSSQQQMPLEYTLQLEAYKAIEKKDYRKAIFESSASAEIVITKAIISKLESDGISYKEKLLSKFRMLGGRFELAEMIKVPLPPLNFKNDLIEPRNNVVHRADPGTYENAKRVVCCTDQLLEMQPTALF